MKAMNYPGPVHYPSLFMCCLIFLFKILAGFIAVMSPFFTALEQITVVLTFLLAVTKLYDWVKKTFPRIRKPFFMANTKFGLTQILAETPKWATWVFRVVLYLAGATVIVVGSLHAIPAPVKIDIMTTCTEVTLAVHGLTKMFGLKVDDPPAVNDGQKS